VALFTAHGATVGERREEREPEREPAFA